MKPKVYEQFDRAFNNITAKAVLWEGEHVANVTIKHGASCVAYAHWIGSQMQRGQAGGGGYDKASAAVFSAIDKIKAAPIDRYENRGDLWSDFVNSGNGNDTGRGWESQLRDAGFAVLNVIG